MATLHFAALPCRAIYILVPKIDGRQSSNQLYAKSWCFEKQSRPAERSQQQSVCIRFADEVCKITNASCGKGLLTTCVPCSHTLQRGLPTRHCVHHVWWSPLPVNKRRAKFHKMPLQWNQQQFRVQLLSVENGTKRNNELSLLIIFEHVPVELDQC